MASIRLNQDTSLNTDGQTTEDQPQAQVENSEKTMGYRSADLTSGGAEFIQGAATGAANVVPRKHLKEL
ncbi:hypothetical protein L6452_33508 [Arctium lappa]|uniref:Uncharacterized protein n=1 Tax=Arctium lappa TaxID=4217 RepID=A0ACB8YFJ3_ARCLA|nr:hypothetical protein L6452_33508 [Arctium lappa]